MGSRQPVAGYRGVDGSVQRVNANADRAGPGGGIPAWHRQPASTRPCRSAVILAGRGRAPAPRRPGIFASPEEDVRRSIPLGPSLAESGTCPDSR